MRPGRIDRLVHVPSPNKKERAEIFKVHLKDKPLADDVDIDALAAGTEGYVGADIAAICREATMLAMREVVGKGVDEKALKEALKGKKIEKKYFHEAIKKVRPTMTKETLESWQRIMEEFAGYGVEVREGPYA